MKRSNDSSGAKVPEGKGAATSAGSLGGGSSDSASAAASSPASRSTSASAAKPRSRSGDAGRDSSSEAEAEPTTLDGILAQYHDLNLTFHSGAPVQRKNAGLPQTQTGVVLRKTRLPPKEDPRHIDFNGVDTRRCWARFLPTDDIRFYDKIMRSATIENAASGPSETYGADGAAQIIQRGGQWVLRYTDLALVNSRNAEVRTYLSASRQRKKSRDIEDVAETEKGRRVDFECGVDGAHLGPEASGGTVEQLLHYAEGKLPQTLERLAATMYHPVEWVGVVLAKPSLAKPRTVDPLLYGVGNFSAYKRPRALRKSIMDEVNKVRNAYAELERKAHACRPNITPEKHHAIAKEMFRAFGKDASDRLEWPEFLLGMDKLGLHWSRHKLKPLFLLGDMDSQGWVSFQDLKYVLLVVSQLPPPSTISLWEYFAEFSRQNKGWINDFEFWKIIHCSTTVRASIEDVEKCFADFRDYSNPTKPEYILRYERFKILWARTVCKYGKCRAELARRGVGEDWMKANKVSATGPESFLLEVIERIDNWDTLCFERAKMQAYLQRKQERMARAEKLHKRTRRRVLDNTRSRVQKAVDDKEIVRKEMVRKREKELLAQTEKRLKDQVAMEATSREAREREVLKQLIKRKVEWEEAQIVKKGKDTVDRSQEHLWRVPVELYKGQEAHAALSNVVLMKLDRNKISRFQARSSCSGAPACSSWTCPTTDSRRCRATWGCSGSCASFGWATTDWRACPTPSLISASSRCSSFRRTTWPGSPTTSGA